MEFLLWLSLNEPDWYPWGCRFDPWPWCCREPWGRFGLLWLWCRLAAAALIWPLAWKLPYAMHVALKRQKKTKQKKTKKDITFITWTFNDSAFVCYSMFLDKKYIWSYNKILLGSIFEREMGAFIAWAINSGLTPLWAPIFRGSVREESKCAQVCATWCACPKEAGKLGVSWKLATDEILGERILLSPSTSPHHN